MKDFKVRIWNGKNNKMICKELDSWSIGLDGEVWRNLGYSIKDSENCEILLSTGLKDVDGNLIYEGDIVKYKYHCGKTGLWKYGKSTINYSNGCFWHRVFGYCKSIQLDKHSIKSHKLQVIGNKFEGVKK